MPAEVDLLHMRIERHVKPSTDVILTRVKACDLCVLWIIFRCIHIMLPCSIEVGGLPTLWFICHWWVRLRLLKVITLRALVLTVL